MIVEVDSDSDEASKVSDSLVASVDELIKLV